MRAQRGMRREAAAHELLQIGPEIFDSVELTSSPDEATIRFFVMTRGAEQAWSAINRQLAEAHGAFFWISGPTGAGKTHFLNYIAGLSSRAGPLGDDPGRDLTIGFSVSAETTEPDREIAALIARELGAEGRAGALWRPLEGADAMRVALDQAKRQGVRAVNVLIDFGISDASAHAPRLKTLADLAENLKIPRLNVIAAGRGTPGLNKARSFAISAEQDEEARVVVGRARAIDEAGANASRSANRKDAGVELEPRDAEPDELLPFHPEAIAMILALADAKAPIASAARIARSVLIAWRDEAPAGGIIRPPDLMEIDAVREAVEARLGDTGKVAARITRAAAEAIAGRRGRIAANVVDLLVLHHVGAVRKTPAHETPLGLDSISSRLRNWSSEYGNDPADELADVVVELGARSRGIILYDPQTQAARFNVQAASAPEAAAFNAALPLIRRFDSTLGVVGEASELDDAIARLERAMGSALERAMRNRAALRSAGQEFGAALPAEQERTFTDFSAIAEAGPHALIAAGGDAERCASFTRTLGDHDILIALGAALPRIRAMREYLESMGLHGQLEDDPRRDPLLARIDTDCKLLLVAINAALHAKSVATLDALESRFQRFKWTYVPHYRAAHEQWRQEMERAARLAEDCTKHLAALRRLNSITTLGPPEGSELATQFAAFERGVTPCTLEGPLAPEITPCCPRCNYVLGTPSPREALSDRLSRVRRALEAKLAVLSQNAIARLIQEHDRGHRLEGFLRIIQAAQTDALIRVLDDKLTRYLARVLEENVATFETEEPLRSAVVSLRAAPLRGRAARQNKMPRDRRD